MCSVCVPICVNCAGGGGRNLLVHVCAHVCVRTFVSYCENNGKWL